MQQRTFWRPEKDSACYKRLATAAVARQTFLCDCNETEVCSLTWALCFRVTHSWGQISRNGGPLGSLAPGSSGQWSVDPTHPQPPDRHPQKHKHVCTIIKPFVSVKKCLKRDEKKKRSTMFWKLIKYKTIIYYFSHCTRHRIAFLTNDLLNCIICHTNGFLSTDNDTDINTNRFRLQ